MDILNIKESIPNEEVVTNLTDMFKILGDPTRAKILFVLEQGELCVNDICECVNMSKYAVSHQLKTLKQAKLVKCKRNGKEMIYSLDDEHVSVLLDVALSHVLED